MHREPDECANAFGRTAAESEAEHGSQGANWFHGSANASKSEAAFRPIRSDHEEQSSEFIVSLANLQYASDGYKQNQEDAGYHDSEP